MLKSEKYFFCILEHEKTLIDWILFTRYLVKRGFSSVCFMLMYEKINFISSFLGREFYGFWMRLVFERFLKLNWEQFRFLIWVFQDIDDRKCFENIHWRRFVKFKESGSAVISNQVKFLIFKLFPQLIHPNYSS